MKPHPPPVDGLSAPCKDVFKHHSHQHELEREGREVVVEEEDTRQQEVRSIVK